MRKLLLAAAAFALAMATTPTFVGSSQAAPAKSPYCNLAKSQRNVSSWNEHYRCLTLPKRPVRAQAPAKVKTAANPYCNLAKSQRNVSSWNEHYHCLALPARGARAEVRPAAQKTYTNAKSPYCQLAKSQRNVSSWNEYYRCLGS